MKHKFLSLFAILAVVANFSWAADYYVAHNGKLNSNSWNPSGDKMTLVSGTTYSIEFKNVGTDNVQYKITTGSWSTSYNSYDNTKSDVTLSESGGNISFSLSSGSDVTIFFDSSNSKSWVKLPEPDPSAPVSGDLLDVLKGGKVMFYYGDTWGSGTKYLRSSSQTSSTVHSGSNVLSLQTFYKSQTETYSTNKYRCNATCQSSAKYYLSNSSGWGGVQMGEKAIAGKAYILNNHSDLSGSSSNNVFAVPSRSGTTWTKQSATITISATSCDIAATPTYSTSVTNQTNTISYYIKNGDAYYAFNPSSFEALAVGEYAIWAICSDGYINVRSESPATLTVTSGEAGVHSISYPAAGKWTYGDGKPAQAKKNDPVSFTATPNDGYTLAVSSEQATIDKEGNTYSFTMPDKNVTIAIMATAQEFGITYPASPSNYTLDVSNPVKGATDATVSFTATPNDGYQLSVTSEQVASFTKNGNTYSFTMPAEAVTINIVASEVPITRILLTSSYDADVYAYSWDRGDDFKQISTSEVISNKSSAVHLPMINVASITKGGQARYVWEIKYYGYSKIILKKGTGWDSKITGDQIDLTAGHTYFFSVATTGSSTTADEYADVTASVTGTTVDQNEEVDLSERLTIGGSFATAGVDFTTTYTINSQVVSNPWTPTEAGSVTLMAHVMAAGTWTGMTAPSASSTGATITVSADTRYRVTFTSTDGGAATAKIGETAITSGDKFEQGSSQTIEFKATPNDGYKFYGWYTSEGCNGTLVSEDATFTETVDAAYSIKAVFVSTDTYQLKHPWAGGDWIYKVLPFENCNNTFYCYGELGNGGFNYKSTIISEQYIQPSDLIKEGDPAIGDWAKVTFDPSAKAITVKKVTDSYTITANAVADEGSATVNESAGSTDVLEGKSATLVATAEDGYGFVGWYDNAEKTGDAVSTDATYVIDAVFAAATYYAKFEAETQYTVTIANNIDAATSSTQVGSSAKEVTADAKDGYVFRYWTTEGDIEIAGEDTDNPVSITATGEGTLTANYEAKSYIYLQNTLNWEGNIYAYLFKGDVWDGYVKHKGVVAAAGKMENMGDGLFRYEYDGAEASSYIAFSTNDMISWNDFYGGKAIYRGDYNTCRPVFVPDASQTKDTQNGTDYYNSGYWQTNDTHTGTYFIYTDNWDTDPDREFIREDATATRGMMSIHLAKGTYEFKIKSCGGSYYGNTGTIEDNINLSTDGWTFDADENCTIKATKEGDYTFYYDFVSHKLWVLYPTYFLKHAWSEGEHSWSWKNCDIYDSEAKTYSLYATYEGEGVNYNTKASDDGKGWCSEQDGNLTLIGDPQVGKPARFTFDPAAETVTIENMYFPITMNKYGYATLYHKENLQIPEGVTAKYVTGTSGVLLTYQKVEGGVIPKQTGVMLFAPANMEMEFVGVDKANEVAPENIMDGSHDGEVVNNNDIHYILTLNDDNQIGMFWPYGTNKGVGSFTNAANKAYIYLSGGTQQPAGVMARKGYLFVEEVNTPTELVDVNANENANRKVLRNGQLIIIRDGKMFSAQGQKL